MSHSSQSRPKSATYHFTAGLGSGLLSAVLLQPADLLKTRVQQSSSRSLRAVIREVARGPRPISQFWRGTVPSALRTGIGSALYFSTLNALRQHVALSATFTSSGIVAVPNETPKYSSSTLPRLSNLANLTTGAIARASVGFLVMPITVIKVRYESSFYQYRSIWGAGSDMFRKEGIKSFFSGFSATALRDAPYAGLYVLFYEQSKKRFSVLCHAAPSHLSFESYKGVSGSTSVFINFTSGLLAAGLATAITNPFDAVKTRMQLHPRKYSNILQSSTLMVKEGGLRSLLDGLGLRMTRKAISSALAWTLYEELVRRTETRWEDDAKGTKL